jgi:hypothetical protein
MYGNNVFSPTLKSENSLPPPSISIVLFLGVTIKVESPCPTSIKYTFKFCGIKLNKENETHTINI